MIKLSFFGALVIIIISSFVGFAMENTWLVLRYGYFDNRNMHLPFLFGYGLAVIAAYYLLGLPEKIMDIHYYLSVVVLVSIGEILLGTLVERTCNLYYWDYSSIPMHITRYTSIPTSLGFGILVTNYMRTVFPAILERICEYESQELTLFAIILVVLLAGDTLSSFYYMYSHKTLYRKWKHEMSPQFSLRIGG